MVPGYDGGHPRDANPRRGGRLVARLYHEVKEIESFALHSPPRYGLSFAILKSLTTICSETLPFHSFDSI